MGKRSGVNKDPKKLGICFQVVPDVGSNLTATFQRMGEGGTPGSDSTYGLNPSVQPDQVGSVLEQLPVFNGDQTTLGVGVVTDLSPVATKMVGLHFNAEIEVANLQSLVGDDLPAEFPYAIAAGQTCQAYVDVFIYQVQVSQSPVTQTFAGMQPNWMSPLYSPERKLLLSSTGIVSTTPGSSTQKLTISQQTQIGRKFEKGDGIGLCVYSRSANGSRIKQVPLSVNASFVYWLEN